MMYSADDPAHAGSYQPQHHPRGEITPPPPPAHPHAPPPVHHAQHGPPPRTIQYIHAAPVDHHPQDYHRGYSQQQGYGHSSHSTNPPPAQLGYPPEQAPPPPSQQPPPYSSPAQQQYPLQHSPQPPHIPPPPVTQHAPTPSSSHAAPPPQQQHQASDIRRQDLTSLNKPHTMISGPFAGKTIRIQLREVQKADLARKCADPPRPTHPPSNSGSNKDDASSKKPGGRSKTGNKNNADEDKETKEQKTAKKDRRPLDPPIVVEATFYEVFYPGTDNEYEQEIPPEDVDPTGLLCYPDLFPISTSEPTSSAYHPPTYASSSAYRNQQGHPNSAPSSPSSSSLASPVDGGSMAGKRRKRSSLAADEEMQTPSPSYHTSQLNPHPSQLPPHVATSAHGHVTQKPYPFNQDESGSMPLDPVPPYLEIYRAQTNASPGLSAGDILYAPPGPASYESTSEGTHVILHDGPEGQDGSRGREKGRYFLREGTKVTQALFGSTYVTALGYMLDMKGKRVVYFVFSDLSVKLEGTFRLRYRVFDIMSHTAGSPHSPVLAECVGGPFVVYSTKEFPGLQVSTHLTRHLSRWGIRVNIRESVPRRRGGGRGGGEGRQAGAGSKKSKKGNDGKAVASGSGSRGGAKAIRGRGESDDEDLDEMSELED